MTKMSRKNKKTLKRKHRKTTKKGTKSIRKMKGGGWSFGFGTSCFDNENTINAAVTTNTTVEERKKAIANYIRNNCEKNKDNKFIIDNDKSYYVRNGIYINSDTNDDNIYVSYNNQIIPIDDDEFIKKNIKVPRIDAWNSDICIIPNNKGIEINNCKKTL